jgi:hypothetical protein
MSKSIFALIAILMLASCGGGHKSAPRNMDNACTILDQRPSYIKAFRATQRKWGVPVHVQMAVIYQESKFISNAKTPREYRLGIIPAGRVSSAYGYAQALDGTWEEYKNQDGRWRAKRTNIRDASDFMGWYMAKTKTRNGVQLYDARNQYLAYHEGHTGYARGSYNSKSWLLQVANQVQARANRYQGQLQNCAR